MSQEHNSMNTKDEYLGTFDKLITVIDSQVCENKNGYNDLDSMSAVCDVKH